MSHVVKSVTKVFSKVWDFVRPIVEIVAVCAAIYFTAGLALSAFPATAGFAAALPGFAADGVAGAGVFSQAAGAIGLGGGLAEGAAADGAITTIGAAAAGSAATDAAGIASSAGATASTAEVADLAAPIATNVAGASALGTTAATAAPGVASSVGAAAAAKVGMSITDKLLLASVGTQALSGFMAPTPADIQKAKNGWYGAFYGVDSSGKGEAAPDLYAGPQTEPGRTFNTPSMDSLIPPANSASAAPKLQVPNMGTGVNMAAASPNMGNAAPSLMPRVGA